MGQASLTDLGGFAVGANTDEVCYLEPIPAALGAGTYVSLEDGSRLSVQGTVAANAATLIAAGAVFSTLTRLDGTSVRVNGQKVAKLDWIPSSNLPAGVVSGTRITFSPTSSINVQGDVPTTITALGSSDLRTSIAMGAVSGAGVLQAGANGATGAVRNGAGDYTVTLSGAPPANALAFVTNNNGTAHIVAGDGPVGATFDVLTFDAAGAAADCGFNFLVLAG